MLQEAFRPFFGAYTRARANGEIDARGLALDGIMTLPQRCLKRDRGGLRTTTRRLNTKLRYIATYARELCSEGLSPGQPEDAQTAAGLHSAHPVDSITDLSQRAWDAKIRRCVSLSKRGYFSKGLSAITSLGMADMTPDVIESLEACFTHNGSAIPALREHTPDSG